MATTNPLKEYWKNEQKKVTDRSAVTDTSKLFAMPEEKNDENLINIFATTNTDSSGGFVEDYSKSWKHIYHSDFGELCNQVLKYSKNRKIGLLVFDAHGSSDGISFVSLGILFRINYKNVKDYINSTITDNNIIYILDSLNDIAKIAKWIVIGACHGAGVTKELSALENFRNKKVYGSAGLVTYRADKNSSKVRLDNSLNNWRDFIANDSARMKLFENGKEINAQEKFSLRLCSKGFPFKVITQQSEFGIKTPEGKPIGW